MSGWIIFLSFLTHGRYTVRKLFPGGEQYLFSVYLFTGAQIEHVSIILLLFRRKVIYKQYIYLPWQGSRTTNLLRSLIPWVFVPFLQSRPFPSLLPPSALEPSFHPTGYDRLLLNLNEKTLRSLRLFTVVVVYESLISFRNKGLKPGTRVRDVFSIVKHESKEHLVYPYYYNGQTD